MGALSLKAKFFITSIVVFVGLLIVVLAALWGINDFRKSSIELFEAVQRSNDIAEIKVELAAIHNDMALHIIKGERKKIQLDVRKTLLFKWLKDKENCSRLDKGCQKYLKMATEYYKDARNISEKYIRTDPTLNEFLADTQLEIFRSAVALKNSGNVSSIANTALYSWLNNEKKLASFEHKVRGHLEKIKSAFNKAVAMEKTGEKDKILEAYNDVQDAIYDGKDGLIDIADSNEKLTQIFINRLGTFYRQLDKMFISLGRQELASLNEKKESQEQTSQMVVFILIIVSLISLMLLAVIIFWLIKTTVNPILIMKSKLEELSHKGGDLTVSLPVVSEDEIGGMTISLNEFLSNLRTIIAKVKIATEELNSISNTISAGTNDASSKVYETSSFVDDISSKLSDISSKLIETESSMEGVNSVIVAVSKKSDKSSKILDQALESMKHIQVASDQIQNVTEVVNEIAFQTNLLSLNAAIEAARAGEYGKGFAVVAGEVRALSQRSSEAAQQIKNLINNASSKIEIGAGLVKESSGVFIEILSEFKTVFEKLQGLSVDLKHNTEGVSEIDKAVNNIRETINSNASFIEEMAATSQEMTNHTNGLHKDVDKFIV